VPLARLQRPGWPTAAVACGVLACGTGVTGLAVISQAGHGPAPAGRAAVAPVPHGRAAGPRRAAAGRRAARPAVLIIPAIGLRTRLIRLGITAAGILRVPPTTTVAGWYTGSPRPGEIGSSVIVGHVDSRAGPGVFFRLAALRPAEKIYVLRADGTLAVFRVTAVRTYLKARFPTAAVYGPVPDAALRLITCGGTFDPSLRSYLSNVVVYAVAVRGHRYRAGIVAPDR
jgi:sortase (surface protein transpeptidase)